MGRRGRRYEGRRETHTGHSAGARLWRTRRRRGDPAQCDIDLRCRAAWSTVAANFAFAVEARQMEQDRHSHAHHLHALAHSNYGRAFAIGIAVNLAYLGGEAI